VWGEHGEQRGGGDGREGKTYEEVHEVALSNFVAGRLNTLRPKEPTVCHILHDSLPCAGPRPHVLLFKIHFNITLPFTRVTVSVVMELPGLCLHLQFLKISLSSAKPVDLSRIILTGDLLLNLFYVFPEKMYRTRWSLHCLQCSILLW
jgi:hypothetical protein